MLKIGLRGKEYRVLQSHAPAASVVQNVLEKVAAAKLRWPTGPEDFTKFADDLLALTASIRCANGRKR